MKRAVSIYSLLTIVGTGLTLVIFEYLSTNRYITNFGPAISSGTSVEDDGQPYSPATIVKIPKIVHQTWKDQDIPVQHKRRVASWKEKNPNYVYKLHTDVDIEARVREKHPELLGAFSKMQGIHKADLLRYMVLYDEGGVYGDIDTECLRGVEEWLQNTGDFYNTGLAVGIEVVTGDRPDWRKFFDRPIQICQWSMAAAPRHPALRLVLDKIQNFFDTRSVEEINNITVCEATGPAIWSDSILEYLTTQYGVTLGEKPFDKDQLENRFSHIGDTLVFPLRALAVGSGGYKLDSKKHSHLDQYVLHGFAGSWTKPKDRPWARDIQGRAWSSRGVGGGGSRKNPHRAAGCYPTASLTIACQNGESPGKESSVNLFDQSVNTKWLQWATWQRPSLSSSISSSSSSSSSSSFQLSHPGAMMQQLQGMSNTTLNTPSPPVSVFYRFPIPFMLQNYTLITGNDAPERDPSDWDIWGTHDNVTYWLLDSRRNMTKKGQGLGARKAEIMLRFESGAAADHLNYNFSSIRLDIWNVSNPVKANCVQLTMLKLHNHPPLPPPAPTCMGSPFSWSQTKVCSAKDTFLDKESPAMGVDGRSETKWFNKWDSDASANPFLLIQRSPFFNLTRLLLSRDPPLLPQLGGGGGGGGGGGVAEGNVAAKDDDGSSNVKKKGNLLRRSIDLMYTIVTADDVPARDPVSWNLYYLSSSDSNHDHHDHSSTAAQPPPSHIDARWTLIDSRRNMSEFLTKRRQEAVEFSIRFPDDDDDAAAAGTNEKEKRALKLMQRMIESPSSAWIKFEVVEVRDPNKGQCPRNVWRCTQIAEFYLTPRIVTPGGGGGEERVNITANTIHVDNGAHLISNISGSGHISRTTTTTTGNSNNSSSSSSFDRSSNSSSRSSSSSSAIKNKSDKGKENEASSSSSPPPPPRRKWWELLEENNLFGHAPTGILLSSSSSSPAMTSEMAAAGGGGGGKASPTSMPHGAAVIPQILHQSWKTTKIPAKLREFVSSWHRYHPTWEYRFWTDADCRELVRLAEPSFMATYEAYKDPILRADASRYLIMQVFGGVYADLDFEALRDISSLLANKALLFGQEPFAHVHAVYKISRMVCNAFIASTPNHPFWNIMFSELRLRANNSDVQGISATGPRALEAAVVTYEQQQQQQDIPSGVVPKNGITITNPSVLYPLFDPANREIKKECEKLFQTTTSPTRSPSSPASSSSSSSSTHPPLMVGKRRKEIDAEGEMVKMGRLQLEECLRLQKMKYENSPLNPNISYAAHHWVHTWFGSYYGGSQDTDAYDLAREIKAKYMPYGNETTGLKLHTIDNAVLQEIIAKNNRLPGDF